MLSTLYEAERALPQLLTSAEGWQSLDIDYHPPRVERLYRPFGAGRLMVHRIAPCTREQALFHPHPWPCAVRVLTGPYEMGTGYGAGVSPPEVAVRLVADGSLAYEMVEPDAWHYVCPRGGSTLSVMVTGPPWSRPPVRTPDRPLGPLPAGVVEAMLVEFRRFYPATG